jgi:D-psicose/D-tagatose/L-ribulose 3-epimerase
MPADPRYAVHAYAWTSSWSNDRLDILDRAKRFGLDAVEIPLMEIDFVDPGAIRERAEAAGIGLCTSVAMPMDADPTGDAESSRAAAVAFLRRCSELTAAMGAGLLGGVTYAAHGRMLDERPTRVHMERSAEVLRQAARDAAALGVTIAIEPCNRYEVFLVNTAAQAVELADMIGEDNVGIHLDTYHMNIEEEDFETPVGLVGERLVHFHLSESHRGVPGRGVVDWAAVMRALNALDYSGLVGLEAFEDMSPAMRAATRSWRDLAPSSDELVREGLAYLQGVQRATAVAA